MNNLNRLFYQSGYIIIMEENMIITVKKNLLLVSLLICLPAVFSYANGNRVADNVTFSDVQDRFWNLTEVKNGSTVINIDRTNVTRDIYTIKFQTDNLVGAGAANSYFASYTLGKSQALLIERIGSSRAAPLYEMKDFTESEYFRCLQRVNRWDLRDGKLELYTYDKNGSTVILIFSNGKPVTPEKATVEKPVPVSPRPLPNNNEKPLTTHYPNN